MPRLEDRGQCWGRKRLVAVGLIAALLALGCGAEDSTPASASGGALGSGGGVSTGGATATGGVAPIGGSPTSGGTTPLGGTTSTGGTAPTGGTTPTGGAPSTGGTSSTGGVGPTGGASTSGGTAGTGGAIPGTGGTQPGTGGTEPGSGGSGAGAGGVEPGAGGTEPTTGGTDPGSGGTEAHLSATAMAVDMGFGTNLANTFENTTIWETGWGMPVVTPEYVQGMAANGIKTVRVPVAWDTFSENGVIPADKLARIREVVQWIVDADMYCIVNIHWDGGWIRNEGTSDEYRLTDDVRQKFASYWQQIATEFAGFGYHLVFEDLNEEGEFYVNGDKAADVPDYAPLNELNQLFVDTVRGQGGYNETRNLLIAGFTTSIDRTCVDAFAIPTDPAGAGRIFVSIHYYEPYTFTLMTEPADWGGWVYPQTTWGSAEELAKRDELFAKMAAFAAQRNAPIILGEFTAIPGEGEYVRETASRVRWLRSVIETSRANGMVPLLFDANYDVRRSDGSFSDDLTAAVAGLGL